MLQAVGMTLLWLSHRLGCPAWHKGYAVVTCVATVGLAMAARKAMEGDCTNPQKCYIESSLV